MPTFRMNKTIAACRLKVRHDTKQEAETVLAKMHKEGRTSLKVFHCQWCLGFHLGGKGGRSRKRGKT